MSSQKAILSNESINKTRGPHGLNSVNLSTVDPENYSGRYSYSLSIEPKFKNNQVFTNSTTNSIIDNKAKIIRIREAEKALREFQFDYYNFEFNSGYPTNFSYGFCNENLSLVHSYHSYFYSRKYDPTSSYSVVDGNNFLSCGCNAIPCPPGLSFDPTSCLCVPKPQCVDCQDSIGVPPIKNTIYGYAFYCDTIREVNIPGVGNINVPCAGGHGCCRTLFKPSLLISDGSSIDADKNICMDNANGCSNDGSQTAVPGFIDQTGHERSDSFTITLNDPSEINNSIFYMSCEYESCHQGVTFIVLVAELASSTDKIIIFSNCIFPGLFCGQPIGTIGCDGPVIDCDNTCDVIDYVYSCYDGECKDASTMGYIGSGVYINDPTCQDECTPTPIILGNPPL